ncbi:hypothetical protein [Acetatifactor aquisgranensis]|uniref:hypothetical protein n=1 Tax=Acetatifactor aquisgranensis TaxID=2941233 RepID=UPI00203FDDC3|nr:hypothetical protein [Acetatifactor aquisgranensis]MCI8543179.1 hypothetical protein [Lachnospiraceae bacterium]
MIPPLSGCFSVLMPDSAPEIPGALLLFLFLYSTGKVQDLQGFEKYLNRNGESFRLYWNWKQGLAEPNPGGHHHIRWGQEILEKIYGKIYRGMV